MLIFWIISILKPFLQLIISTYLHRWQLCNMLAQTISISCILTQHFGCLKCIIQHIKGYLIIHCATCCYRWLSVRSMLWRNTWTCNHISIFGMTNHCCEIKIGCSLQLWIESTKEILIACKQIALPQMCGKPTCSIWPNAPCSSVNHTCCCPDICVMVCHIAFCAIHLLCCFNTCLA